MNKNEFISYSKTKLRKEGGFTPAQFDLIDSLKPFEGLLLHSSKRFAIQTISGSDGNRCFLIDLDAIKVEPTENSKQAKAMIRERVHRIPQPSAEELESYLNRWSANPNTYIPEAALNKLFKEICPGNRSIEEVALKVAALNTVYATQIYSVYPVAKHIVGLNMDDRLAAGDERLVDDMKGIAYEGKISHRDHYSFASKYCSFHNPEAFPIYDSYVEKVLLHYRDANRFCDFKQEELKDYPTFKRVIAAFQRHFGLEGYTVKQIDQYLWQFGKEYEEYF